MAVDDGESGDVHVPPLENTAHFAIDVDEGYVRVEQSHGNHALYTPDEARDVAEAILEAAENAAEGDE